MGVCSSCGAPLNPAMLNCEYCDTPISNGEGVPYSKFIKEFNQNLLQASSTELALSDLSKEYSNTSSLIKSLYIPADSSDLTELAAFVIGQMQSSCSDVNLLNVQQKGVVSAAWIGKSKEVFTKISLMGGGDIKTQKIVSTLEQAIIKAEKQLANARKHLWYFYAGFLLLAGVVFLAFAFGPK